MREVIKTDQAPLPIGPYNQSAQLGYSKDMIFNFDAIISYASRFFKLMKGDLIFTGTPAGVGPIQIGDTLEGYLEGNPLLYVKIK